ncbi:MAG TPA: toll/interleukin-1 receptor domain-containing protein [Pyrinomonadaceae bacterium]|jgi:tetratricopeptide (TPR) repeat protein
MSASDKSTIFISYSHIDEAWKNRLRPHLKLLENAGLDVVVWDDRSIDGGAQWYNEIKAAMDRAVAAICLISADYLASDFCHKEEIPYLLERRKRDGMVLLPILVRPCLWSAFKWLKDTQMIPRDGKSIAEDFKGSEDKVFLEVAEFISNLLNDPEALFTAWGLGKPRATQSRMMGGEDASLWREIFPPPHRPEPRWWLPAKDKIEISRLPVTGAELFGRRTELEMLDAAWASDETNVVSLVAWGGVGKSTLVNKWRESMEGDNYRGAQRVYAWSFYSQGTSERVSSADLFISEALKWFGDADPTAGSPWDKGERLARLVQKEKTLLLLDGLEPLQSPHAHERGKIKDPALLTLLTELARHNPGLCLISTRERVSDLAEFEATTVLHKDLEQISDEAGRALLRVGGVQGIDAELEQVTRDFGNYALAINLLAVYLHDITGHHVSHAAEIPDLDITEDEGKHPRRVIEALARRFGDTAEVELLRLLGFFDRPADKGSLRALRRAPVIHGLTDYIRKLTDAGWLRTIEKLRRYKLIAPQSNHRPDDLDAHPLVREHFKHQLKLAHPEAWKAGNYRLYEHLKRTVKMFPNTLKDMVPLYSAIVHGCEAGRHQEVLEEVYLRRIIRGKEFFSLKKIGSFGVDLAILTLFFKESNYNKPIQNISESAQGSVLGITSFCLQALGRTIDATQVALAALEICISHKNWEIAARGANNLSLLYLTTGDLNQALVYARRSTELAKFSGSNAEHVDSISTLAHVLHLAGSPTSEAMFIAAEKLQKEEKGPFSFLHSVRGFDYCDLLLSKSAYVEVKNRAGESLKIAALNNWLLDIGLDCLSLGRAYQFQTQHECTGDFSHAASYLNRAVDGLRQAEMLFYLPLGLLARAELYRVTDEFERAQTDLDEVLRIAKRGSMGLHEADCYLEYARLYLAQNKKEQARESWETAKGMIARMGYHRRDRDVVEIEEQLNATGK